MESFASLMSMLATGSIAGVLAATMLERLIPILPSYLLLLSIGIATGRSGGSPSLVIAASLVGSIVGAGLYFLAAGRIGASRSRRWGYGLARFSGVSRRRVRRLAIALLRNAPPLSLLSQLIPGVRLIAPGMAGAIGLRPLTYFAFASIGMAIWNAFFIGAGYIASVRNPHAQAASIALVVIGLFVSLHAVSAIGWWSWRRFHPMNGATGLVPVVILVPGAKAFVE